jgi:hypothetical protein
MQRILFALDVGIDYMYISNSLVGLLKGVAVYQGCASVCVRFLAAAGRQAGPTSRRPSRCRCFTFSNRIIWHSTSLLSCLCPSSLFLTTPTSYNTRYLLECLRTDGHSSQQSFATMAGKRQIASAAADKTDSVSPPAKRRATSQGAPKGENLAPAWQENTAF